MRNGVIASAILHLALVLLTVLVVPMFDHPLELEPATIPIDVVQVGPTASPTQGEPRPLRPAPPPPVKPVVVPPPPVPKVEPPPPTPPKPAPPKPEPPKPEPPVVEPPKPEPPKVEPPKPTPPKPEPPKPTPPKPEPPKPTPPKPTPPKPAPPKVEPPKPTVNPLDAILKDVEKLKHTLPQPSPTPAPPHPEQPAPPASGATRNLANTLTSDEKDGVIEKVRPCWNVFPGDYKGMAIHIVLEIARNGTVTSAEIQASDRARMITDPLYNAAAGAALRAVRNPACQPLPLPPEKYDEWRNGIFTFHPEDLF